MSLLESSDPRPVHFIGIAGAGMSALAELFVRRGARVTGTDSQPEAAPDLVRLGVTVSAPDVALVHAARAVVYSSAIPATHPEIVAARAAGLPLVRRAEALAEAVSGARVVGIAGTHGKTTTTVMTTMALAAAGAAPTGIVGGRVAAWEGNLQLGGFDTFVVEADEYDRSFLALTPTVAVVLNIEADHLDIYRDLHDIHEAFARFASPAHTLVACADDAGAAHLARSTASAHLNVLTYSSGMSEGEHADTPPARLVAQHLQRAAEGSTFSVALDGVALGDVTLRVPGLHNVRNALAAIGAGLALGATVEHMAPGLAAFAGVERRFQQLGTAHNVRVIDDYAHHPTEVAATIEAARVAYPDQRLVIAFQPHLYSRTRDFATDFARALAGADVCLLCDIYPARETPIDGVSSALIANAMRALSHAPVWEGARAACAPAVLHVVQPGDVVITMGAGDITRVGPDVLTMLAARTRSA